MKSPVTCGIVSPMTKKNEKSETLFVIGARPPQKLSAKAKEQLANAKPSKKTVQMAQSAAKLRSSGIVTMMTAAETTKMFQESPTKVTASPPRRAIKAK